MIISKNINGYIVITTIHNGYLVKRCYGGYTLQQAKKEFKNLIKKLK